MNINDKIYVAGHKGLVGSAIIRKLNDNGYNNIITRTSSELDLTRQDMVEIFFKEEKPDFVFLAAAKVGGIHANKTYPANFIYQNLMIQNNIIHQSWVNNVKKLIFLGSSCIYPKLCPQPIKEEYLMTGPLETTNSAYAVAKIAGIEMCWSYNRQYDTKFIPIMPTNLYGPNDNYDLETSHVLPALIRKFHEAKQNKFPFVTVWGTGTPKREFLHVDDLADACLFIMNKDFSNEAYLNNPLYNVGTGIDISIKELAILINEITGYKGELVFDKTKPDGTPQKLMDVSKLLSMDWQPHYNLRNGIIETYNLYIENLE